jgi:hypothetical protein
MPAVQDTPPHRCSTGVQNAPMQSLSRFRPFRVESPTLAKSCLTVAVCVVMAACAVLGAEQTIFDLSTYPEQYQGKTVKVKCQTITRFAGGFFCDDGTTAQEDVVQIDPDSVDKDALRYLKTRCNEPSVQCSASVTGRFEASEYGDFYIRNATFKFTTAK